MAMVSRLLPPMLNRPHTIKARPEPFPPGATQISASLSPIIITDIVGSTEARNLETVDTEGETDSEVGKGKGKEVSGVVTIRHQHTFPLPGRCQSLFTLSITSSPSQ